MPSGACFAVSSVAAFAYGPYTGVQASCYEGSLSNVCHKYMAHIQCYA